LQLCVAFCAHAPWLEQAPLLCHAPPALQVWVSVPQLPQATGFVWPGAQVPAQLPVPGPDTHVALSQATSALHTPLGLHVSTPLLDAEHRVVPGVHCPVHAPATHAVSLQGVGVPHIPDTHACVAELPEHCTPPAGQGPVHTPAVQVEPVQSTAAPHWPSDPQSWTPLPEQRVAPGAHTPAQAPATHAWLLQVWSGESETRSAPHRTAVTLLPHTALFGLALAQSGSIAAHVACVAPGLLSQFWPPGHVDWTAQTPPVQVRTTCCALPSHAFAPGVAHGEPNLPTTPVPASEFP
jgi:hypothetical protein